MKPTKKVPFNVPPVTGTELDYLASAFEARDVSAKGVFTERCQEWLEKETGALEAFLIRSGSAALEMAAILTPLEPGDEVVMPSFAPASIANALALRGAVAVLVDIRSDTRNLDENLIESAITARTKAICVMHYAGVCAEMSQIREIATRFGLIVIEDASHALLSTYGVRPAGSLSHLACFSFHETNIVTAGEGGAIAINEMRFIERARIVWDKGTNGHDWVDIGSSFAPSELTAAILFAQLQQASRFRDERVKAWARYQAAFADLENAEVVRRPYVPPHCVHNGHLYYLILRDQEARDRLIDALAQESISAMSHYVPLHSSPAGARYARTQGRLIVSEATSAGLVRLPMYAGLTKPDQERVIDRVIDHLRH